MSMTTRLPDTEQKSHRNVRTVLTSLRRRVRRVPKQGSSSETPTQFEGYKRALVSFGAVKVAESATSAFTLRNGAESNVYIDHGELLCEPQANSELIRVFSRYVISTFGTENVVVVNVDSKSSPHITGAIAATGGYRQIVVIPDAIHKAEKGVSLRLRLPSKISENDAIVVIDDVLTPNDQTALDVIRLVRREVRHRFGPSHANIEFHLIVGVIRNPEAAAPALERNGVSVRWLVTLEELINDDSLGLKKSQKEILRKELSFIPQSHGSSPKQAEDTGS